MRGESRRGGEPDADNVGGGRRRAGAVLGHLVQRGLRAGARGRAGGRDDGRGGGGGRGWGDGVWTGGGEGAVVAVGECERGEGSVISVVNLGVA